MAEDQDKDSKTEEPTEKKIRDAIEKGNLPFSKEVAVSASFVAMLLFVIFFAQRDAVRLARFLGIFLERPDDWVLDGQQDAIILYRIVFLEIGKVVGVLMLLLVFAGVAASVFQNAPRFVLDRVQPKLSRISPVAGWKRLFGAQGLVEFLKAVGKLLIVGGVLAMALKSAQGRLLDGMITSPAEFMAVVRDITIRILVSVTLMTVVIALADLLWTRFKWHRDLRMSHRDIKDEMKQSEGDPIVKARIRSVARDRARQRMMAAVPQATLVIANPTHFAIALRYNREKDAAPLVVAKGQDLIALRIREIAEANGIPVFEDVALARSMYKQVSVDSMIPSQFYQAVAELVRVVYARGPAAARSRTN